MPTMMDFIKRDSRREIAFLQLRTKFGRVSDTAKYRVLAMSNEQLVQLLLNLISEKSLKELGLED